MSRGYSAPLPRRRMSAAQTRAGNPSYVFLFDWRFAQKVTVSTLAMVRRSIGVEAKGRYILSTWRATLDDGRRYAECAERRASALVLPPRATVWWD